MPVSLVVSGSWLVWDNWINVSQAVRRISAIAGSEARDMNKERFPINPFGTDVVVGCSDNAEDLQLIAQWLREFEDSPNTLSAYRKEAIRLVIWCHEVGGTSILKMSRSDIDRFKAWLLDPGPQFIGSPRPLGSPKYRPFTAPLSVATAQQALRIIGGLYAYLVDAGSLERNPFTLLRRKRKSTAPTVRVKRYIPPHLLTLIYSALADEETFPTRTEEQVERQARARWVFSLLLFTGMRRHEAAAATTAHLSMTWDEYGRRCLVLTVLGKGGKEREIPVIAELANEYSRYRTVQGLPADFAVNPAVPLVLPLRQSIEGDEQLGDKAIYRITKLVIARAVDYAKRIHHPQADELSEVTTHWLRHSFGSALGRSGTDIRVIADLLGHTNLSTARIYLHNESWIMRDIVSASFTGLDVSGG